jgi:hypothetical protein
MVIASSTWHQYIVNANKPHCLGCLEPRPLSPFMIMNEEATTPSVGRNVGMD